MHFDQSYGPPGEALGSSSGLLGTIIEALRVNIVALKQAKWAPRPSKGTSVRQTLKQRGIG